MIKNIIFIVFVLYVFSSCKVNKKESLDYILDSVHHNLGEGETESMFNDPLFLKSRGYNGTIAQWYVSCAINYDNLVAE